MHNELLLASQTKRRISDLFQIYSLVLKNWNNIYELAKNKIPHVFRCEKIQKLAKSTFCSSIF
jgi:hypothetical protein